MFETEVASAKQSVAALCDVLDPASVLLPEVPGLWADLDAMERQIAGAKLRLATAIEDSGIWSREGFPSAAHWLAKRAGVSVGRAKRDLKTSGQLKDRPATDEAVQHGRLSPDQAAEVASAATADPAAERKLLDKADRSTLHELKDECEKVRSAAQPDDTARDRRCTSSAACTPAPMARAAGI